MDTTTENPDEPITLIQLMENFFHTYPPAKAERLLWHWSFLCAKRDFSSLSEEKIREFTDFFRQMEELASAVQKVHKDTGVLKKDEPVNN